MISEAVYSGRLVADLMFREEPDSKFPFSGWVFLSSQEPRDASTEERGLEFHDCRAILRVAPEVAVYLDMPPGTKLVRTGEKSFQRDTDESTP